VAQIYDTKVDEANISWSASAFFGLPGIALIDQLMAAFFIEGSALSVMLHFGSVAGEK
jgi:hypothetical protein